MAMSVDDLYALVNRLLPPVAVALVALAATFSSLFYAWLMRRPRAIALAVGTANVAGIYLWTHLAGLSITARAIGIRLAIVVILVSILFYNQSAQPVLFRFLRQALARAWGRITGWKK